MKKVLVGILVSLVAMLSVPAHAQICDTRRGVDHFCGVQHSGGYRGVQWHHNHGYRGHGGLNSTEKVIIGAVIGGIVVDAIHRNRNVQEPVVVYSPPQPTVGQTCTTREVFDRYGRLISTERTCY